MPTAWARYVRDITAGTPQHDVATASEIEPSVLSRWLSGQVPSPRAEQVIKLSRAYGRPPVEALVAAGYLKAGEAGIAPPPGQRAFCNMSNAELIAEIRRLTAERSRLMAEVEKRLLA